MPVCLLDVGSIPPLPPLNPTLGSLQRSLVRSTPNISQLSKSKTFDSLTYSESKSRHSFDRPSLSSGLGALGSLTDSQDFLDELPVADISPENFFMSQYPYDLEKDKKIFRNTTNNTSKSTTMPPTLNISKLQKEQVVIEIIIIVVIFKF